MSNKFQLIILSTVLIVINSAPSCKENENFCRICDPFSNLCSLCQEEVFIPDQDGGCKGAEKCVPTKNYCIECNKDEKLCNKCDVGYFPDANGGCTYTQNCQISSGGQCLKCEEDFALIGEDTSFDRGIYFCKSIHSDDLINCKEINLKYGYCNKCEDNYYLTEKEKKCIKTKNCAESIFGVCTSCAYGHYLNKKEDKCMEKTVNSKFIYCKETIDGETCEECIDGLYMAEDGKCASTNHCSKVGNEVYCKECIDDYYLAGAYATCSRIEHCYMADKDTGFCYNCTDNFYYDTHSKTCLTNLEDNEMKFCKVFTDNQCVECEKRHYLGEDNKCTNTTNCVESKNGVCTKCKEEYHLGKKDNKCTNVEHCVKTDFYYSCIECEENYYIDKWVNSTCIAEDKTFKGCLETNWHGDFCQVCTPDYYLNYTDHLCYSNKEKGDFYKCHESNLNATGCASCIEGYYMSYGDYLCTKVPGCYLSQDENTCLECRLSYCMDMNKHTCILNYEIEKKEEMFYFRCNKTNKEGNACEECDGEEYTVNKDGLCYDNVHCESEKDGICEKCVAKDENEYHYCANDLFGCVETIVENCLRCDDIFDFFKCTECVEGYQLDEYDNCVKKN